MKLGRLPKKVNSKTLWLNKYGTLDPAPKVWAWEYAVPNWPVFRNDQIGDCTCAAAGHMIQDWTVRTYGMYTATDDQIVAAYSAVSGYNSSTGANDNGAHITDVLALWQSQGIANHKILGWAEINNTNVESIKQAISIFGGIDIGFNVPQSVMDEFIAGNPWNDTSSTDYVGGHSVPVFGYGSRGLTCVTWGKLQPMSWDFWAKYVDEAYAIITQDFLDTTKKTPISRFDLSTLQTDLAALKKNG